jgi:GNAT superfamily N-acetyltransferase
MRVPTVSDDAASLQRLLDSSADALLVAEVDSHVVGALIAAWDGWRGNLCRLAVLPAYRRHGIARQLVGEGNGDSRARVLPGSAPWCSPSTSLPSVCGWRLATTATRGLAGSSSPSFRCEGP